jgi:ribosome biogenesis GTPase
MDYSKFGLGQSSTPDPLTTFGWRPAFASQLTDDERDHSQPARVTAVHRNSLELRAPGLDTTAPPHADETGPTTVGDWVLIDPGSRRILRRLDRQSLFQRRAAGETATAQPIAANVDTLFVVTSCNADFNEARLERYLILARAAGVPVVVLLTKSDLSDPDPYLDRLRKLDRALLTEALDTRAPDVAARLFPWLKPGQTVAFVGSSGVGKTTLANALRGSAEATAPIREDDAKGRHTTTARALHQLPSGAWILDTPGMRELGLTDAASGIDDVFSDIAELASGCRFSDCAHDTEPGCAITAALEAGTLDPARLARWRRLRAEDAFNSATIAERRSRDKRFGKMVKTIMKDKRR